jgi:hypothetical protein
VRWPLGRRTLGCRTFRRRTLGRRTLRRRTLRRPRAPARSKHESGDVETRSPGKCSPRLCLSLALTSVQSGHEEAAVKWLFKWAPRRFKNCDVQEWSRHIFSLPGRWGAIYVDGLHAPLLFVRDLPKLQEQKKVSVLEKPVEKSDRDTQAEATTSNRKKVSKPLRIVLPYGLSPHRINYISDTDERHDIDAARIASDDRFQDLPCWVCLQHHGPYHNDLALLVSVEGDLASVFVVPRLPTSTTELKAKKTYPPRRFLAKTFQDGFPGLVNIERIDQPVQKDVMTFMDSNKELRSTGRDRMLLGEIFTFRQGLLLRKAQLSECIRTWPSCDELVQFGVFGAMDIFSLKTTERTVFNRISFIPWSQYQDIRSSNHVRFVGTESTDSALVVKVEDGMAQVRHGTGEIVGVPLDLLCLDFRIGQLVQFPPSYEVRQPLGCEPRQALWAIDGYSFADSRAWTTAFVINVGRSTLDVLVGRDEHVSFHHLLFNYYTHILIVLYTPANLSADSSGK